VTATALIQNIAPNGVISASAVCPAGKSVVGGGTKALNYARYLTMVASHPDPVTQSWFAELRNINGWSVGFGNELVVYAICANVQ
jgi:hypothetical protein